MCWFLVAKLVGSNDAKQKTRHVFYIFSENEARISRIFCTFATIFTNILYMKKVLDLGQSDDFGTQFGWVNLTDLSEEEFEKERQAFFKSCEDDLVKYGQETLDMLSELKKLAHELYKRGVPQERISREVECLPELMDLQITSDYRILIPECGNAEIELDPKSKALYFLFLRHKEGLLRSDLCNFKDELAELLMAILDTEELSTPKKKAIDNLISKTKSKSFDDSCNIIKREFLKVFDESTAAYYYIYGEKGHVRGIRLPRVYLKVEID